MALMILAHPYFNISVANKTIIEELKQQELSLEIRNIHDLYPTYQIDEKAEQEALLRHDLIILQYPMFWFNMPAILKLWFDSVFTYQFAYGSKGDKLKHKKLLPSLTIGQTKDNFFIDQHNFLEDFMTSVKKSAEYMQMEYLQPICLFDVSSIEGNNKETVQNKAKKHSLELIKIIRQL